MEREERRQSVVERKQSVISQKPSENYIKEEEVINYVK